MIRLGVIGLGTIFATHIEAIKKDSEYQLAAVCDCNLDKITAFQKTYLSTWRGQAPVVYTDNQSFFRDDNVDAVLIATPPATHFALALEGIRQRKHILLEKPAVNSMEELQKLYRIAEEYGVLVHVAYHAAFARDLEWYLENRNGLEERYDLGTLRGIDCTFFDPYMKDNEVLPAKRALGGCFIDSGVNALSVCARLTDLSDFALKQVRQLTEESFPFTVYRAEHRFHRGDSEITIQTRWDTEQNRKSTTLEYSQSEKRIHLLHSRQQVILENMHRTTVLYTFTDEPRLLAQYQGVFRDFAETMRAGTYNQRESRAIHGLLFAGK